MSHVSVLLREAVERVVTRPGVYVDGTLGNGGHARAMLERMGGQGVLIGIDRDPEALERARANLAGVAGDWRLVHGNYADVAAIAAEQGFAAIAGMLLDLGVSSEQLDTAERGFGFLRDGPLDMRMNPTAGITAAGLVATLGETELADLLWAGGEERFARRVARAIVRERAAGAIATTGRLAEVVARAVGGGRGGRHPATRTFQALRIAVNDELGALRRGLEAGLGLLAPGGRLGVIAFHSGEDRIVKTVFASHAGRWASLPEGGEAWEGAAPPVRRLTRKPLEASAAEAAANPRARSARLRVVERLAAAEDADRHDGAREE